MDASPANPRCRPVRRRSGSIHAFTLVELLVVIAVVGVLLALIVPAANQMMRGSNLTQSVELASDQLVLARQAAITSNRRVQVRFYQLPVACVNGANSFCAMQTFRIEETGHITALTKLQPLRANVMFASDAAYSTILHPPGSAASTVTGTDQLPAYGNRSCSYVGFQYLPDGSTDLDPTVAATAGGWFITLVESNRAIPAGQPPANFGTLCVDPVSGHVRQLRP